MGHARQHRLPLLMGGLLWVGAGACGSGALVATDAGTDAGRDLGADRGRTPIALTPADSLFQINDSNDFMVITVTSVSGACNYVVNRQVKAGASGLVINLMARPVAPGTYQVTEGGLAGQDYFSQAYFMANDDACRPLFAITPFARSGTLTITALSETEVTGSYDVTFGNGTNLVGSFTAAQCGPILQLDPTCVP
jgi:hypothetical protein